MNYKNKNKNKNKKSNNAAQRAACSRDSDERAGGALPRAYISVCECVPQQGPAECAQGVIMIAIRIVIGIVVLIGTLSLSLSLSLS